MKLKKFINMVKTMAEYEVEDYSDRQPALIQAEKEREIGRVFLLLVKAYKKNSK